MIFSNQPYHMVPTATSPSTLTTFPDPDLNFYSVPRQALSSLFSFPHTWTSNPSINLFALTRIPSTILVWSTMLTLVGKE